jgi:colanic acid/amylovoran biosynthesis glycosyltransferase
MMLAVAAPYFNTPSETFIRDHARMIAPGMTALICLTEDVIPGWDGPVLSGLLPNWRAPGPILRRATDVVHRLRTRFIGRRLLRRKRREAVDFLREHRVEAVLAEYGPTGCDLADACAEAGVPLFVHFHGHDASELLKTARWRRNYARLYEKATGIIAPSRFLAGKLIGAGCPERLLHVVYNGIDASRFAATQRQPFRILAVGRLVEKKRPDLTIKAFAEVLGHFPSARLDVIGDGPLMERCRALTNELSLGDAVRLHGAQPADIVREHLGLASLFVQHSVTSPNGDTEGFGISIVEAMASEIPVVATRHNGFVETIQHGETGLLVDEGDVSGMAKAMTTLLDDPPQARKMGVAGRERVLENFTHERTRIGLRAVMGLEPLSPQ